MLRINTVRFEHKEWERSAGGTGSPPQPDLGPEIVDPALKSGSRRDPLPRELGSPGAPSPNPPKPNTNA
jgi:hypothetical protein